MRGAAVLGVINLCVFSLATQSVVGQTGRPRSQWDGIYADAQAERGRGLYTLHCARCHGRDLEGIAQRIFYPGQPALVPTLIGDQFVQNWTKSPIADLLRRVKTSMPQDNIGALSSPETAGVVAFLLRSANYPSGRSELPARFDQMGDVLFVGVPVQTVDALTSLAAV